MGNQQTAPETVTALLYRRGQFEDIVDPIGTVAALRGYTAYGEVQEEAGYIYTKLYWGSEGGAELQIWQRESRVTQEHSPYPWLVELCIDGERINTIYLADDLSLIQFVREYAPVVALADQGLSGAGKLNGQRIEREVRQEAKRTRKP